MDGQPAESLLVRESDGHARLRGEAAQRERRELDPEGGLRMRPTSLALQVLTPAEIRELITLAAEAREDFPALEKDDGGTFPADIEFGIAGGQAVLLQIRPFLENRAARSSALLAGLDGRPAERAAMQVDLDAVPGGPGRLRAVD